MADDNNPAPGRTVIGGRHGSPSVTIAWPFSNIVTTDKHLRDAVADLAGLVARLAAAGADKAEREVVRVAAEELAESVASAN